VRFAGASPSSTGGFERTIVGWYLLAGRSWLVSGPITPTECQAIGSLSVRALVNGQPVTATGSVPASACSGAP
jgi:hypothetical protein